MIIMKPADSMLSPVRDLFESERTIEELPGKTKDGENWIRWTPGSRKYGWVMVGTREPRFGTRPTFWESVLLLGMHVAGNTKMDAGHVCGDSVLALGAMGFTFSSGLGQTLLGFCLESAPSRMIRPLCRLAQRAGVYIGRVGDAPRTYALRDIKSDKVLSSRSELELAVRCGSSGGTWSPAGKERSFAWLNELAVLRDDIFDKAQVEMCAEVLPTFLSERTAAEIGWPKSAGRDAWQYTGEQTALWALVLILSIDHAAQVERALSLTRSPGLSVAAASDRLSYLCDARSDMSYSELFRRRVARAHEVIASLFHIGRIL